MYSALSLALAGSSGETHSELSRVLHLTEEPDLPAAKKAASTIRELSVQTQGSDMKHALGAFFDKKLVELKDGYKNSLSTDFGLSPHWVGFRVVYLLFLGGI